MSAADEEAPAAAGAGAAADDDAGAAAAAANAVPGNGADEAKQRKGRPSRRQPFSADHFQRMMRAEFVNVFGRSNADYRKNAEHFYKANAMVRAG